MLPNTECMAVIACPVYCSSNVSESHQSSIDTELLADFAGDPIETGALRKAITSPGASPTDKVFSVGAVKSLTGHLEGTAGLAGLMLCMLRLDQHAEPPLRYRNLNPYVEASLAGWHVAHRLPIQAGPAVSAHQNVTCAGTSSFSMSGVNAHAIVSQPGVVDAGRQVASEWRRDRLFAATLILEGHPMLTRAVKEVSTCALRTMHALLYLASQPVFLQKQCAGSSLCNNALYHMYVAVATSCQASNQHISAACNYTALA